MMDAELFQCFERNSWNYFRECLEKYSNEDSDFSIDEQGRNILCKTEEDADTLMRFLNAIGFEDVGYDASTNPPGMWAVYLLC